VGAASCRFSYRKDRATLRKTFAGWRYELLFSLIRDLISNPSLKLRLQSPANAIR